jgi:hypothetical protein
LPAKGTVEGKIRFVIPMPAVVRIRRAERGGQGESAVARVRRDADKPVNRNVLPWYAAIP